MVSQIPSLAATRATPTRIRNLTHSGLRFARIPLVIPSMNDRDFRLAKSVLPRRYSLRIDVDLDRWQFTASEQIDVQGAGPTAESGCTPSISTSVRRPRSSPGRSARRP